MVLGGFEAAQAQSSATVEERVQALEDTVAAQSELIQRQQEMLAKQQMQLETLREWEQLWVDYGQLSGIRGGALAETNDLPTIGSQVGQATESGPPAEPVGEAPPEAARPEVAVLAEAGGVLTPKGHLVVEPSLELSHASVNRFTFRGVELQEVILIGVIEASDADRNLISPALTLRYGVTDRFEVEGRVPVVYRTDRVTFLIPVLDDPSPTARTSDLDGFGIGDPELAAHYQLTDGPLYVIGNLRYKAPLGKGPFDVDMEAGVPTELPTGSGFHAVEPSVTFIYPSEPAVLFASLSYQVNVPDSINLQLDDPDDPDDIPATLLDVDPGDAIGASIGIGFAVNERLSFSLGYKHTYVLPTESTIFTVIRDDPPPVFGKRTFETEELQIGALLFGLSYVLSDSIRINSDFELGITADAPDVRAVIRLPVNLGDVFGS